MKELIALINLFLQDKHLFNTYYKYIQAIKNIEKEYKIIFQEIYNYYNKYKDCSYITNDEFIIFYFNNNPSHKGRDVYTEIFTCLDRQGNVNKELILDVLKRILDKHYAAHLAEDLLRLLEGASQEKSFGETVTEQLSKYSEHYAQLDTGAADSAYVGDTADVLFTQDAAQRGLKWRLSCFNEFFGPLNEGVLGLVFARSDTGKTSWAVSEATFFAEQLEEGESILYCCNEESAIRTKRRAISAVCGKSREQILEGLEKYGERYALGLRNMFEAKGGERIKFFDSATHISQIQAQVDKLSPRVIFVDQGPKVRIYGEDKLSDTNRLQAVFAAFRELGKHHNVPVICLGQADAQSEGRKWLGLNNIDSSKVGVPGELDFCVGIGRIYEQGEENSRYINVCKNKLFNGLTGRGHAVFHRELCLYLDH